MKKAYSYIAAIVFAVLYPFSMISSSFSVKNFYFGFHSFSFIYLRYLIIFITMIILVYLNRKNEKLFYLYIPTAIILVSIGIYIEYFITQKYIYNYGYLLWTGVVFSVTNAGVFIGATLFFKGDYGKYYKRFWLSYLIFYLLILYVSFIRSPDFQSLTVNTQLGNGTLKYFKAVFNDSANNLYTSLICFGNVLILFPLPFIIYALKRPPIVLSIITGALLPFLFEGYQYFFKCGDVDIDDIVLNFAGYLAALIIAEIMYKKELKKASQ